MISFKQYADNKSMHHNTPFTITRKGVGFYKLNGRLVSMKEFNRIYPIDTIPKIENRSTSKGFNVCKKQAWINGNKSY